MIRQPIGVFLVLAMVMCFIVMPALSVFCGYLVKLEQLPYTFHTVVKFIYDITNESATVPGLAVSFFIFLILGFNGAFNERT
jgi:uncharacterized membrane protein